MEIVIHVDKCAAGKKANPMVGFYHEGKAHIYCSGWKVYATDETCEECKACPGWIFGNQCYEDAKNCLKEGLKNDTESATDHQSAQQSAVSVRKMPDAN